VAENEISKIIVELIMNFGEESARNAIPRAFNAPWQTGQSSRKQILT
jgi:hypothetical protein